MHWLVKVKSLSKIYYANLTLETVDSLQYALFIILTVTDRYSYEYLLFKPTHSSVGPAVRLVERPTLYHIQERKENVLPSDWSTGKPCITSRKGEERAPLAPSIEGGKAF